MNDFDKWWNWYQSAYPKTKLQVEQARIFYNAYYNCHCETCEYRKQQGKMPMRISPVCNTPIHQLSHIPGWE